MMSLDDIARVWNGDMNSARERAASATVPMAETALSCLFRLGAQNGTYTEVGAVRRRHLLDGPTLTKSQLIEIAPEFGLNAEAAQLDWQALRSRPFSHPLLLILNNGNAVI